MRLRFCRSWAVFYFSSADVSFALGLTLLGPVIVNIVLYHIFLDRSGLPMAIVISILALFLLWVYRYKFPAIFQP